MIDPSTAAVQTKQELVQMFPVWRRGMLPSLQPEWASTSFDCAPQSACTAIHILHCRFHIKLRSSPSAFSACFSSTQHLICGLVLALAALAALFSSREVTNQRRNPISTRILSSGRSPKSTRAGPSLLASDLCGIPSGMDPNREQRAQLNACCNGIAH